jgi:hypothetical protein
VTLLINTVDFFIGVAGLATGIAGFSFTIWQLLKTQKAAVAAEKAAQETQSSLQNNVMLVDISTCLGTIEEIKTSVRSGRYEAALLRVTDLISQLIQVRQLSDFSKLVGNNIQSVVSQLSILRNTLEASSRDPEKTLDATKINKKLSDISDCLNGWIGVCKYSINKGD